METHGDVGEGWKESCRERRREGRRKEAHSMITVHVNILPVMGMGRTFTNGMNDVLDLTSLPPSSTP